MIAEAFKYPLTDDDYPRTLLIGSLLVVGSVLVLPAFVLIGFFTRAIGNAINGDVPPRFEEFGGLFIDGVKVTAVWLAYIIGFVVLGAIVLLAGSIHQTVETMGFLLLALSYFGLMYAATSILYHFSRRGRVRDAFDLRAIVDTAFSLRYFLVVLLWLLVLPTIFTFGQVLLGVTIVGLVLLPATLVYELIVYAKLIGNLPRATETSSDASATDSRNANW